jgi:hypothetical protein
VNESKDIAFISKNNPPLSGGFHLENSGRALRALVRLVNGSSFQA